MNPYFHNISNQPLQILFFYLLFFFSKQSVWLKNSWKFRICFLFLFFMWCAAHLWWKIYSCEIIDKFKVFSWKNVTTCLKIKKSLNFNSDVQLIKGSPLAGKNNASVDLILQYKNGDKIVTEEILVYDTPGMVSQIGGILSLFLGFSFFSLLCDLFEFIQRTK